MRLNVKGEQHFSEFLNVYENVLFLLNFCRYGRVNFVLAKRLELLSEVQRLQVIKSWVFFYVHEVNLINRKILNLLLLQESLDVHGDVSYTCETAGYFFLYQVTGDK